MFWYIINLNKDKGVHGMWKKVLSQCLVIILIVTFTNTTSCALDPPSPRNVEQIAIPSIETYPNHPYPYSYFDYKQRAIDFDSFIYDWNQPGELPTISVDKHNGVRIPSYYGDARAYDGESIVEVANIVSAKLNGIDKSSAPIDVAKSVSILLSENFDNGENFDYEWNPDSGVWVVESYAYKGIGNGGQCYSFKGDVSWTDYTLEANVKLAGGSNDAGLAFRVLNANNFYLLKIAASCIEIYKCVNGVYILLSTVAETIPIGSFHNYKVEVKGNSIKAYKDGLLKIAITDSTFGNGKIGVRAAGTTIAYFDRLFVTKGSTVVVSSYDSIINNGYNAIDYDKNSYWSSQYSDSEWIYVDLGETKLINRISLDWHSIAYATSYKLQISNDAINWVDVYTTSSGTSGLVNIDITPSNARYVRMYGIKRASIYGFALKNFAIYSYVDYISMLNQFFSSNPEVKCMFDQVPDYNTGAGGSWWYDTLPNVLFFMLGDLYPDHSLVVDKLKGIADSMYDMVVSLGGENCYFNYTYYDFLSKQGVYNGVWLEPDAGLAVALIEYWAYAKFGDEKYLNAARWIINYYDKYSFNPHFEVLTIFAPYVVARMNAEQGTNFDVNKYFTWLFTYSDARPGYKDLTGTWNGLDINGLLGANYYGGYGFPMNTFLTAFFAPAVKYDHRYARTVGKYILNASNSMRFTFADQIPANRQYHGSRFINKPEKAIPYEGFIRFAQGFPEGTAYGDPCVQPSWGCGPDVTDLSIYSGAYMGFYGAILNPTNVDKILQIDVNKLDFFKETSYPTYLYYNPYFSDKSVQITLSSASDLFNSVTGEYIARNVSGTTAITIPADSAVVLVVAPADSTLTYSGNKTLINGVPVAYSPPSTELPFIENFDDGNNDGWSNYGGGNWLVESGSYKGIGSGGQCIGLTGDLTWDDYTYEAKVKLNGGSNDAGLIFRSVDSANFYLLKIAYNGMELYKCVNGTYILLSSVAINIPTGNFYNYKIVVNGNSIKAYKDGILRIEFTDGTFTKGRIGVRSAGTTVAYFDDIYVTN